jgi:hypothetical protein
MHDQAAAGVPPKRCPDMPDLPTPRPMTEFDPAKPALLRDPMNEVVWEWPGVTPAQWAA